MPAPSLAPAQKSKEHAQLLAGTAVIIRAAAEAVRAQHDFDDKTLALAGDPNLNTHLTTARKYAEAWIGVHQKNILDSFTQIQRFDNDFSSYIEGLVKLASAGLTGDNLSSFEAGLAALKSSISEAQVKAKATLSEVTAYQSELSAAARSFSADVSQLLAKLGTLEATKDAYLFNTEASYAASLDKNQLPDGLKQAFADHHVALDGVLLVNVYAAGQRWAISSVSYNDSSYNNFKGYTAQSVWVLEISGDQMKVYTGKQGVISALQDRYQADEAAMNKDLEMIAGGAVAAVVGVLIAVVGLLAEIPTAGAATVVVGSGVAVAVTGVGVAIDGGVDYSRKSSDASSTLLEINQDEYLVAVLPAVCTQVTKLAGSIQKAVLALGSLVAGWQEIGDSIDSFSDEVKKVQATDFWVSAELQASKKSWADLKALVTNILFNFQELKVVTLAKSKKLSEAQRDADTLVSAADKERYRNTAPAA